MHEAARPNHAAPQSLSWMPSGFLLIYAQWSTEPGAFAPSRPSTPCKDPVAGGVRCSNLGTAQLSLYAHSIRGASGPDDAATPAPLLWHANAASATLLACSTSRVAVVLGYTHGKPKIRRLQDLPYLPCSVICRGAWGSSWICTNHLLGVLNCLFLHLRTFHLVSSFLSFIHSGGLIN
ncbi:hypothetical protein GGI42DRAFT_264109 [Trichoderma sp. SZMC 28013]